jgi:hypothetical protein
MSFIISENIFMKYISIEIRNFRNCCRRRQDDLADTNALFPVETYMIEPDSNVSFEISIAHSDLLVIGFSVRITPDYSENSVPPGENGKSGIFRDC